MHLLKYFYIVENELNKKIIMCLALRVLKKVCHLYEYGQPKKSINTTY